MRVSAIPILFCAILAWPSIAVGQTVDGVRPLRDLSPETLAKVLVSDSLVLGEAGTMEAWLDALDGQPPDWTALLGPSGQGDDDRLFALNRERDAYRKRSDASSMMQQRVTFFWAGELSDYDPYAAGFHLALGPVLTPTRWGIVRFKPEGLPGLIRAIPPPGLRESLRSRITRGERIEVHVAVTGRLVPDESLIYMFAHEEQGRGMVMPVVGIERLDYFLAR